MGDSIKGTKWYKMNMQVDLSIILYFKVQGGTILRLVGLHMHINSSSVLVLLRIFSDHHVVEQHPHAEDTHHSSHEAGP